MEHQQVIGACVLLQMRSWFRKAPTHLLYHLWSLIVTIIFMMNMMAIIMFMVIQESFSNSTKTCSQSKFHICTAQVFTFNDDDFFIGHIQWRWWWLMQKYAHIYAAQSFSHLQMVKILIKEEQNRKKLAACAKSFLRKLFDFAPPRSLFSEMFTF